MSFVRVSENYVINLDSIADAALRESDWEWGPQGEVVREEGRKFRLLHYRFIGCDQQRFFGTEKESLKVWKAILAAGGAMTSEEPEPNIEREIPRSSLDEYGYIELPRLLVQAGVTTTFEHARQIAVNDGCGVWPTPGRIWTNHGDVMVKILDGMTLTVGNRTASGDRLTILLRLTD